MSGHNRRANRGENRAQKPRSRGIPVIFLGGRFWRVSSCFTHVKAIDRVALYTNTIAGWKLRFAARYLIPTD